MIGSIFVRGRWARAIWVAAAAGTWACASQVLAQDGVPPLLRRDPLSAGAARGAPNLLGVTISLYRDTLTGSDKARYNEIFGNFADAVFEATEGQHIVDRITVFQNGQPFFDTPPVVDITGLNPASVEVGQLYLDSGATAFDIPDGILAVFTSDSVYTAVAGTYFVSYFATDSSGNTTAAFRKVNVIGKDPVITIRGQNPLTIFEDSTYEEFGATAFDVSDGNITGKIVTTGLVSTGTAGTYFKIYTVTDLQGNTTQAVRKINVVADSFDSPIVFIVNGEVPPAARLLQGASALATIARGYTPPPAPFNDSDNPLTIEVGDIFIDTGAVATDLTDGNVPPGSIQTFSGVPVDAQGVAQIAGTFFVTYTATDGDGNSTTETRTVVVVGKDPVITLNGTNPVSIEVGTPYVDAGATAVDVSDGDLTADITTINTVNTTVPGTYFVRYAVTDSNGNTVQESRQVIVLGSLELGQTSDIFWLPSGVPSFRLSGGIGTPGGQIAMYDIFDGGEAGADIDFLATPENRRRAGYILASLWMQYYLGLGGEFQELGSDIAVTNSLLADPFSPTLSSDGLGLNLSATLDGVATAGQFDSLEHTQATPQFRLQGASAWATIARAYGPKPARLIAKRPRTFYPELVNNAPVGTAAPTTNLVSLPTGPFFDAKYIRERTFFRIATENSLPVVRGNRKRAANGCVPGRLIDIPTTAPMTFEFPVDSDLHELSVALSSPCFSDLINLDVTLTDPQGRIVDAQPVSNPEVARVYRQNPPVAGTWRLQLSARSFTAEGVRIDVYASSFGQKHRISADLVNEPSNLATTVVSYPNPIVLQVSDTAGRAIRGATVKGNLRFPTGTEIPLTFIDNGSSPDLIANDGSYSIDLRYPQNGDYHLEVSVIDLSGSSSFTSVGTSRAPSLGASLTGIVSTPAPADEAVGEPYMRGMIFDFTVQGLVADDHGNTSAEFTSLLLTNADKPGRIDTSTDTDYFRIQVRSRAAVDTVARVTHASGTGQFLLRMFDSTGSNEIGRGSNGPSGYPQIRKDLEPGVYFLALSASGAKIGDTYSVSAGPPIPSDLAAIGIDVISGGGRAGGGGGGGGGCFIATAAYGTPLEAEIDQIRALRDERLLTNPFGAAFTDTYYRLSPPVAGVVAQSGALRVGVRGGIEAVLALMNLDARALLALGAIASMLLIAGARRFGRIRV